MPPKLAYIMLQLLDIQREKSSLIQLHISFHNEDEGCLLKWLKET